MRVARHIKQREESSSTQDRRSNGRSQTPTNYGIGSLDQNLLSLVSAPQITKNHQTSLPAIQRAPMGPSVGRPRHRRRPSPTLSRRVRPTGVITREQFDEYVRTNFGATEVKTGTEADQIQRLTRPNRPAVTIQNWQPWDPGPASEDYSSIINGIEDMVDSLGAMPRLNSLLFFKRDYTPHPRTGVGIPRNTVGASFGGGELIIYRAFAGSTRPAISVSTPQGTDIATPNRDRDIRRNMVHELGHGVAEAAMAQDMQTFVNFKRIVGWIGRPPVLYDMGQPEVREAIANRTAMPAQHIITPARWDDHTVSEQPISRYAVRGGPAEDFAESITAYVNTPLVLMARSPRRFEFIRNNMNAWQTQMRTMDPAMRRSAPGDYPLPEREGQIA